MVPILFPNTDKINKSMPKVTENWLISSVTRLNNGLYQSECIRKWIKKKKKVKRERECEIVNEGEE